MAGRSSLDVGIVLSTLGLIRGGVETRAVELARGLQQRGHEVTLVGGRWPGRPLPDDIRLLPVRLLRVPCVPLDSKHWRHIMNRRPGWPSQLQTFTFRSACLLSPAVRRLIAQAQVTVTLLARDSVYVSAWRKRRGKPNLSYYNGGGRRWLERDQSVVRVLNPMVRENSPQVDDFIFHGTFPPGIPSQLLQRPFRVRPQAKRLLFVGRLEESKGVFELIAIFQPLAQQDPLLELRLVGDGPLGPEMRKRIARAGLESRVSFAGALSPQQVWTEMAQSDLLVLPMLHGNFPLTLLESEAAGLPVVSSDLPGVRGAVSPESRLLPVPEWDQWVESLRRLIPDAQTRRKMSQAGQSWAKGHTWDRSVDKMEGLLRKAVRLGN